MTLNGHQAIIFDMDGLLVDSEWVWHLAETDMIERHGHQYTNDVRSQVVGLRMDEFLTRLIDIYQLPDSLETLRQEILDRMAIFIPERVKTQPGAKELIAYVQAQGIPTAIASSSPTAVIETVVKTHGWEQVFAIRCSAEFEPRGKPAPDVYLAAARALNIDPRYCLALEDSPVGARAAIAAGMTCYAVPDHSHTKPHAFEGVTPHVFDSLHTVLAALRG